MGNQARQPAVDILIVGAGIVGLTIARTLKQDDASLRIVVLEKESELAFHASGRNSGVLHAGFYYTRDSMKARFTRDGNRALTEYCKERGLDIQPCGKVVIATNDEELAGLEVLKQRGEVNGIDLEWVTPDQVREIDPNVRVLSKALWSPTTASVNPKQVCQSLARELEESGVAIHFGARFLKRHGDDVVTNKGTFSCGFLINAAGLHADRIARLYGHSKDYVLLPFKGLYLMADEGYRPLRTNVYPVPNLKNPFLGVHFTLTVANRVKIGPTAIPCFWRENYRGLSRFSVRDLYETLSYEARLFLFNAFNFRKLVLEEVRKYRRKHLVSLAARMAHELEPGAFRTWGRPGIRAQLLDTRSLRLVQDFVIEKDDRSLHVLNAVSPAFTCSFPFARSVVDQILSVKESKT